MHSAPLIAAGLGDAAGQGWLQIGELALAFAIASVGTQRLDSTPATVAVTLEVQGRGSLNELSAALTDLDGVLHVAAGDVED